MERRIYDEDGRYIVPRVRRRRYEKETEARYLTFSCYDRLPLFHNDRIKDLFANHLAATQDRFGFRLIAWVVMPEHVYLLLVPRLPEHPVPVVLQALKQQHARDVLDRWRQLEALVLKRISDSRGRLRFWQRGGGYDRNIHSSDEFHEKLRYIHENPVRRGLVQRPTDWRWSSARAYAQLDYRGPVIDRLG